MDFATYLDSLIIRSGLSTESLADAIRVNRNTLTHWRSGQTRPEKREDLIKLAKVLELSPSELKELLQVSGYEIGQDLDLEYAIVILADTYRNKPVDSEALEQARSLLKRAASFQNKNFDQAFSVMLDSALRSIDANFGRIYLLEENKLVSIASKHPQDILFSPIDLSLSLREGVEGVVAQTNITRVVNDTRHDPNFMAISPNILSEVVIPLRDLAGSVIGILSAESDQSNSFSQDDAKTLEAFVTAISLLIQSILPYRLAQFDITMSLRPNLEISQLSRVLNTAIRSTNALYITFGILKFAEKDSIIQFTKLLDSPLDARFFTAEQYEYMQKAGLGCTPMRYSIELWGDQFLYEAGIEPLKASKIIYGSPLTVDLLGISGLISELRETIKDITWRGKHEKQMANAELKDKRKQAQLDARKTELEIQEKQEKLYQASIEREKLVLEIVEKSLSLLKEVRGLDLPSEYQTVLASTLIPQLMSLSSNSRQISASEVKNLPLLSSNTDNNLGEMPG